MTPTQPNQTPKLKNDIGSQIRDSRKRLRLTQAEVAERLGMTRVTYNGIENGHSSLRWLDGLLKLGLLNRTVQLEYIDIETIKTVIEKHGVVLEDKMFIYCTPACLAKAIAAEATLPPQLSLRKGKSTDDENLR